VIGNGTSRLGIDLDYLKQFGKTYACNAVFREYTPNYLVAVDTKMINEINQTGWQMTNEVWTNPNKQYNGFKGFNYFSPSKGWSSGPTALWMASKHNHLTIYVLGFDFRGLLNQQGNATLLNNVYAGTKNYKKKGESATYFGNWERQTATTMQAHGKIRYIRVTEDGEDFTPKALKNIRNLTQIQKTEFKDYFKFPS